jgi:hypothetical protein
MSAIPHETIKSRLENVIALARLLDRIDNSPVRISADQYQALVRQLARALAQELPDDALQAVLGIHPSAAELYENAHYAQSGLSRSSLEQSVRSEMLASQALARAARAD